MRGHKINMGAWESCIHRCMEKMTQLKILPLIAGVSRSTVDCCNSVKVEPCPNHTFKAPFNSYLGKIGHWHNNNDDYQEGKVQQCQKLNKQKLQEKKMKQKTNCWSQRRYCLYTSDIGKATSCYINETQNNLSPDRLLNGVHNIWKVGQCFSKYI